MDVLLHFDLICSFELHVSTLTFACCISFCADPSFWWPPPAQASCSNLSAYLQNPLSQYLVNVSTAAELCSQALCAFQGRCLRRNPDSDVYLHLNPLTHTISSQSGRLEVNGDLDEAEKSRLHAEFRCQCYSGYHGQHCEHVDALSQGARPPGLGCVILLIISLLLCWNYVDTANISIAKHKHSQRTEICPVKLLQLIQSEML